MNDFNPTSDQLRAMDQVMDWWKLKNGGYLTLGGFAGTGKTTLMAELKNKIKNDNDKTRVAFCAFTGKASQVLKNTLNTRVNKKEMDNVSTIHSLIYCPIINEHKKVVGWTKKDEIEADLIVVDEASMINRKVWEDLKSFGVPILAVGDHGQLPPVGESFNLMETPMIKLEKIHRQAEDNPIIKLSMMARNEGKVPIGRYGDNIRKLNRYESETGYEIEEVLQSNGDDLLILAGYNKTRINLNKAIRNYKGYESDNPEVGDKVICLKNNWQKNVFNGMSGKIASIFPLTDKLWGAEYYEVEIEMENGLIYDGKIKANQFGNMTNDNKDASVKECDFFDFGYALTVHKAQGSQAKRVLLFEERFPKMSDDEWKRWLYTGITRAEKELIIIGV